MSEAAYWDWCIGNRRRPGIRSRRSIFLPHSVGLTIARHSLGDSRFLRWFVAPLLVRVLRGDASDGETTRTTAPVRDAFLIPSNGPFR